MDKYILSIKLSYEEYLDIFSITITFGLLGLFISFFTYNYAVVFVAIIPGVLIDILKFTAKIIKSK
ncbi:hypothetical protein ACFSTA_03510 [Ornithinibacillus salinisoli]|uniref:Uncharacterized protein n=1 Tax=Ornithinibacillus salinisoli TaxID=1848459 RepID=A0ABW4VYN7_9BACI